MYDDDIKRRIMVEPSTKIERNPKFKVGEIVYRVNGNDTEEFLVVAVGINIEELIKTGVLSLSTLSLPNLLKKVRLYGNLENYKKFRTVYSLMRFRLRRGT